MSDRRVLYMTVGALIASIVWIALMAHDVRLLDARVTNIEVAK